MRSLGCLEIVLAQGFTQFSSSVKIRPLRAPIFQASLELGVRVVSSVERVMGASRFIYVLLSVVMVLSSCGGGGGGSSDGAGSSDGIRVLHAAIDAPPVDLLSSARTESMISQVRFADTKGYRPASKSAQTLSLTKAFSPSSVIGRADATISSGGRYSLLLYGDVQTFGLKTRFIEDQVPQEISGAAIKIVHGVTGAAAINVSVGPAGGRTVPFGEYSEYISVPAGEIIVSSTRASDGRGVSSVKVLLAAGKAYTMLLAGQLDYYVKPVLFLDK